MKAIFNGQTIAESNDTVIVEGNHYFPKDSVDHKFLTNSELHTVCPWKGEANYYNISVNNELEENGAWYYPNPSEAATAIKGRIAFWKNVKVTE